MLMVAHKTGAQEGVVNPSGCAKWKIDAWGGEELQADTGGTGSLSTGMGWVPVDPGFYFAQWWPSPQTRALFLVPIKCVRFRVCFGTSLIEWTE